MPTTLEIQDPPLAHRARFGLDPRVAWRWGTAPHLLLEDQDRAKVDPVNGPHRIAYLTNAYPKISHSFIRNEILALEREGIAVHRITIRGAPETLIDPIDRSEQSRTAVLLNGRPHRLLGCVLTRAVKSP